MDRWTFSLLKFVATIDSRNKFETKVVFEHRVISTLNFFHFIDLLQLADIIIIFFFFKCKGIIVKKAAYSYHAVFSELKHSVYILLKTMSN